MNMLRNAPVIYQNRQIGFLQSAKMDDMQKRVLVFVVARGFRGKCLLPVDAVKTVTDEFIIVEYLEKYDRKCETYGSCFVYDTDGLMIGKVTDYAIDEETWHIAAIEVNRGYLPAECKRKIWFYSYSVNKNMPDEMIVPAFSV